MKLPFALVCEPPFLIVEFEAAQDTLGWSLIRPGFAEARQIAWLEVRNADLSPEVDPVALLRAKFSARGLNDALAFMTSRDITRFHVTQFSVGEVTATCVATVGLSNGEHVGKRVHPAHRCGTINTLVHISKALGVAAFVEAISIVAEARTAAILATAPLRAGDAITGTGTDCIIVAAPKEDRPEPYAGLHTEIGEVLGAAVFAAVYEGAAQWSAEMAAGSVRS